MKLDLDGDQLVSAYESSFATYEIIGVDKDKNHKMIQVDCSDGSSNNFKPVGLLNR